MAKLKKNAWVRYWIRVDESFVGSEEGWVKKTLEGLLNDGYRTWKNYKKWKKKIKRPSLTRRFGRSTKKKKLKI